MKRYIYIIIFLLFGIGTAAGSEKLHIVADIMRGEMTSEGPVRMLEGNVHLRQGLANLYCNRARWYVDQHRTILEDSVKYDDGIKTLTAQKIIYNDTSRVLHAVGDVVLVDSIHTMFSDKAVYYDLSDRITAQDNVIMLDNKNNVKLTGEYANYLQETGYAIVEGNPVLIKMDSTGQEEIRVIGIKMELLEDSEMAMVTDSVKISHENGTAYCDTAIFNRSESSLKLVGEPIVWQKYDRLTGDQIELYFHKNKLDTVFILGDAEVRSPVDTLDLTGKMNTLLGLKITLDIEENKLGTVQVDGQATSQYYIFEKDAYKGVNKIIGDKILVTLKDRKIDKINIESDPGSSTGVYYPPEVDTKYQADVKQ